MKFFFGYNRNDQIIAASTTQKHAVRNGNYRTIYSTQLTPSEGKPKHAISPFPESRSNIEYANIIEANEPDRRKML